MLKEKFKKLISSKKIENGNNKKQIENLVIFVIILIITVIAINYIWKDETIPEEDTSTINKIVASSEMVDTNENVEYDLEKRLKNILKSMKGVGNVEVLINYSETSTVIPMYNENVTESSTEETDSSGGIRTILETDTQKEVVYSDEDGNSNPVTEKIVMPKIEGAIITFEGASNASIKTNVIEAVKAVTGLASHKIQVFEMSK